MWRLKCYDKMGSWFCCWHFWSHSIWLSCREPHLFQGSPDQDRQQHQEQVNLKKTGRITTHRNKKKWNKSVVQALNIKFNDTPMMLYPALSRVAFDWSRWRDILIRFELFSAFRKNKPDEFFSKAAAFLFSLHYH